MKVKICGLTNPEDAAVAGRAGADYVGAVLVPDTPRAVPASSARELGVAAGLPLVIVVADLSAEAAAEAANTARARVIQLHGAEPEATLHELRELGDWELWKVVRVKGATEIIEAARRYEGLVETLLLDAWHPDRLGGTGSPFPWEWLDRVQTRLPTGLSLGVAGGLNPENVREAIRRMRPDIVDVSSGVERSRGCKDPDRVRDFIRAAREEWEEGHESDPRSNELKELT